MSQELMLAISNNEIEKVKDLLKNSEIDLNYRQPAKTGNCDKIITPLIMAASKGYIKIVELLLSDKRTDLSAVSGIGRSPLSVAAYHGQLAICKLLLPISNILAEDNCRLTAFGNAIVSYKSFKDVNFRKRVQEVIDFLKVPTFVEACAAGDLPLVKRMIEEHQVDINAFYDDTCGLLNACLYHQIEVVEYLLSLPNINVNIQAPSSGDTPLHIISRPENLEELLTKPFKKYTEIPVPLYSPSEFGDQPTRREYITLQLIQHGADVNLCDLKGITPLMTAVMYNALDIAKILVEKGKADLNLRYSSNSQKYEGVSSDAIELAQDIRRPEIYRYLKEVKFHRGEYDLQHTKQVLTNYFKQKSASATANNKPIPQDATLSVKG